MESKLRSQYIELAKICHSWKFNKFLLTTEDLSSTIGKRYTFSEYEYLLGIFYMDLMEYSFTHRKTHPLMKQYVKFLQVYRLEKEKQDDPN